MQGICDYNYIQTVYSYYILSLISGSKVNYYLTGMGHECCYDSSNINSVPKGSAKWYIAGDNKGTATAGFSAVTAATTGMTVSYYDQVQWVYVYML